LQFARCGKQNGFVLSRCGMRYRRCLPRHLSPRDNLDIMTIAIGPGVRLPDSSR
jgi:hypothetical protein